MLWCASCSCLSELSTWIQAGALGQFAAGAEFAFGTIVQRTMAEPGGARFHYGHPDVWNKLFTMTRGGVSKATRAFHISEDVFGGYNAIFRGAVIKYKV
jgi:1,3-beta-glucan synthase